MAAKVDAGEVDRVVDGQWHWDGSCWMHWDGQSWVAVPAVEIGDQLQAKKAFRFLRWATIASGGAALISFCLSVIQIAAAGEMTSNAYSDVGVPAMVFALLFGVMFVPLAIATVVAATAIWRAELRQPRATAIGTVPPIQRSDRPEFGLGPLAANKDNGLAEFLVWLVLLPIATVAVLAVVAIGDTSGGLTVVVEVTAGLAAIVPLAFLVHMMITIKKLKGATPFDVANTQKGGMSLVAGLFAFFALAARTAVFVMHEQGGTNARIASLTFFAALFIGMLAVAQYRKLKQLRRVHAAYHDPSTKVAAWGYVKFVPRASIGRAWDKGRSQGASGVICIYEDSFAFRPSGWSRRRWKMSDQRLPFSQVAGIHLRTVSGARGTTRDRVEINLSNGDVVQVTASTQFDTSGAMRAIKPSQTTAV